MPEEPNAPHKPAPMTTDQLLAEMFRENERLQRQLDDAHRERDQFKNLLAQVASWHAESLTAEDLANAVPARPLIEQLIQELEKN